MTVKLAVAEVFPPGSVDFDALFRGEEINRQVVQKQKYQDKENDGSDFAEFYPRDFQNEDRQDQRQT